jgi:hypothetical protein
MKRRILGGKKEIVSSKQPVHLAVYCKRAVYSADFCKAYCHPTGIYVFCMRFLVNRVIMNDYDIFAICHVIFTVIVF